MPVRREAHAEEEKAVFEAFLAAHPSFATTVKEVRQPDQEFPESRLVCTALDFYAARCGVLHTHSAESDLKRQGSARPLIYEWRQGPRADAQVPLPPGAIIIEVEALHEAFKAAVSRFLMAADTNPEIKTRVRYHLKALLCYRPWPLLRAQVAA